MQASDNRVIGIDVVRCLALFGMFAVHTLAPFDPDGDPTASTVVASGRSAATFALMAGIGIVLSSGRDDRLIGRALAAARAGLVVRALVVTVLGGLLGLVINLFSINVAGILVYYGIAFLAVVPLVGLSARALGVISAVLVIVAPVADFVLRNLAPERQTGDPTIFTFLADPSNWVSTILITGYYPVIILVAYLTAGMAIGRLDMRSTVTATKLLVAGVSLALAGWLVASILLFDAGGREQLFTASTTDFGSIDKTATTTLWWPETGSGSWWELAQRAPHSYSTFDLVHTIGCSMALLGLALLVTRIEVARFLLRPLAWVGSIPLTIYGLHIVLLAMLSFAAFDREGFFVFLVSVSLITAAVVRSNADRGPLEFMVGWASRSARDHVLDEPGTSRRNSA